MTRTAGREEIAAHSELQSLIGIAARIILREEDAGSFLRWLRDYGPQIAQRFFAMAPDPSTRQALAYALGRAIWNATPLPSNRFRPRVLPAPGRNEPCPCGSEEKYKHCCGAPGLPELPVSHEMMLAEVLDLWPTSRFRELPYEHLSPEVLAGVAADWLEEGSPERAMKLLEPLFARPQRLDQRAEHAFEVLADAYTQLHRPRKKAALIERLEQARNAELRAAALQRRCTMLADQGRFEDAWRVFREGQRACPDHPAFGHLEVVLLINQGKADLAAERARFWIGRLRRSADPTLAHAIEFLERVAADPYAAMMEISATRAPGLIELKRLLGSAAPIEASTYRAQRLPDARAVLEPGADARTLEKRWYEVFPHAEPMLTEVVAGGPDPWAHAVCGKWLAFLGKHPRAFDSFQVLDDLVLALHQLPDAESRWLDRVLLEPLLERARALLEAVLAAAQCANAELSWGFLENRPALRLLANLVYLKMRARDFAAARPLLEHMVYKLNPNDNHGMRALLARVYLELDENQNVLELAARYPDDGMAETLYSPVLALYRLGRLNDAAARLRVARRELPEVHRFLIAEDPKPPRLTPGRVTFGGKDEAWYYREEHEPLWRRAGAIDWLRAQRAAARR